MDIVDSLLSLGNQIIFCGNKFNLTKPVIENYKQFGTIIYDSIFNISLSGDSTETLFSYRKQDKALGKFRYSDFNVLSIDSFGIDGIEPKLMIGDSACVFASVENYDDQLYLHGSLDLFRNISAFSPGYLAHFEYVFRNTDFNKIYIGQINQILQQNLLSQSPLKYILQNRGLKYAYFGLLILGLLYLIFGAKRRQKIIEITRTNENSSVEFVKTLSRLYERQNQNEKLVSKMENSFYHFIQSKYFIKKQQQNFQQLVADKSRIDVSKISLIIQHFKTLDSRRDYDDHMLFETYKRLEDFYKNAK